MPRTERTRPPAKRAELAGVPLTVAAVDLGSNSFHLVIARVREHDLQILDRVREPVCLAAGLDDAGRIDDETQERALACLERIGQRLRDLPAAHVRVVGTNTLRHAENSREFRARAEVALGRPIEVISGQEEARLIHLGVAHSLFSDSLQRLVIDIGGGSTEVIVGEGFETLQAHSLFMGCVTHTRRFFPDGALRRDAFRAAEIAGGRELLAIESRLRAMGWSEAIGASGTVWALREILRANGWGEEITLAGLKKARKALIATGSIDRLSLPGLKPARAPVLPGGLAIMIAAFKSLRIESMSVSPMALKEGVLYDLLGRIRHDDTRDGTIRRLVAQYHVDLAQATRVERTALALLRQLREGWEIDPRLAEKPLVWASRLHEIGLAVSFAGYHRHGRYLVTHSDLPGFSSNDQVLVATLIGAHRRKLSRSLFGDLPPNLETLAHRLCVIFRVATLLNRGRSREVVPTATLREQGQLLELGFPEGWSASHPLTFADLLDEVGHVKALGIQLRLVEVGSPVAV